MANIAALLKRIESGTLSYEEKLSALSQVEQSLQDMRQKKQEAIQSNVMLIVDALKQMQVKVEQQLEEAKAIVPQKGPKGDRGEKGDRGLDGAPGKDGRNGIDGKDGKDGNDGISVTDAKIDFDGSLVITLSNGREINVGEVLPLDVSDKIKVIANGGGTSQTVVDTLTSLQNQINTLTGIDGVLGDMAQQNANNVAITGGAINGATIGGVTPAAGTFTTLTATGQTSLGGVAGSESLRAISVTSAVNWIQAAGNTAGTGPILSATGSDTNVDFLYSAKGTAGSHVFRTNTTTRQFQVSHTASAVNYVQVTGAATGNSVSISAQGSDANVGVFLSSKGSGNLNFQVAGALRQRINGADGTVDSGISASGGIAFKATPVSNQVNYLQAAGNATGLAVQFSAQGSDTNISQVFQSKGTGAIDLAAGSSGVNISNGGTVTALTTTNGGSNYTSVPTVTISPPTTAGGVQAVATAAVFVSTLPITSAGSGYAVGNTLTAIGGTGIAVTFTVSSINGSGGITGITLGNYGYYTATPANPVSFSGGAGTGFTSNMTWTVHPTWPALSNAGSGYVEQPTVSFSGGGGSGAAAYATVGSGTVVKSIGSTMDFYTPEGVAFRTQGTSGQTSAAYWIAYGHSATPILRGNSGSPAIQTVGTGSILLQTNSGFTQAAVSHTASAVNYVQVTGAATGSFAQISAQGSDAITGLGITSKGAARINFFNNNGTNRQVSIGGNGAAAVNYLDLNGSATGIATSIGPAGTDTNIALAFQSKGTGAIDLAAGSSGVNISNGGTVTALTVTASGSGYTSLPTPAITAPTTAGGVQAVAAPVMFQTSFTITNGGTGYTVGDTITGVGGTFTTAWSLVVSTVSGGVITGLTTTGGFAGSYTVLPVGAQSVTGGTGTGATITINTWALRSLNITTAGSGYVEQPTVSFSGGGGSGAAAYATVGSQAIIKGIGSSTGTITAQSIMFQTPSGNSLMLRDSTQATPDAHLMGQATANGYALLMAEGSNANASLYVGAKGSGSVRFNTNSTSLTEQLRVSHTASAVNYVQVTGAATGGAPTISAQGSDTNINLILARKGSGTVQTQGIFQASTHLFNFLQLAGGSTGNAVTMSAGGGDTNIDLALTPKGTGNVRFGTYTGTALTIAGYIEIKDSGGTVRKLAVVA